jgi:tRNA-uridine 2-sulfurtransferase
LRSIATPVMRVAIAMSGGVDSLFAAMLLKEQGHQVFGLHMILSNPPAITASGRIEQLLILARKLGLPLHVIDMRDSFEAMVVKPFVEEYRRGRTPNPCALCNPAIKFGALLEEALMLGADRLATGHYTSLLPSSSPSGRCQLQRGRDPRKDQSYFLHGLSQRQLQSSLFPLGDYFKEDAIRWAQAAGFWTDLPAESQEICFIPSGNYQQFVAERLDFPRLSRSGPILDTNGNRLGEHKGLFAYTIGQRRGLGISSSAPYYVLSLDPATNTVTVGRVQDLYASECFVKKVNWVSISPPEDPLPCLVRIRNQHEPAAAVVQPLDAQNVRVRFERPQRAITPGQSAVFYHHRLLLGGGTIRDRLAAGSELPGTPQEASEWPSR